MPNTTSEEIKKASADIVGVWSANPDFKLKDITLAQFQADAKAFADLVDSIATKEQELKPLRNSRDDLGSRLEDACVRLRAGIKGYFGGNSSEYELVGGTRASERKKTVRKAKGATGTA